MMIFYHRVKGHQMMPFRVTDTHRPWRWQCSCGKVFGGPYHQFEE